MSKSKRMRDCSSNNAALDFGAHELEILKNDMERFGDSQRRSVSRPDSGSVAVVVSRLDSYNVLDCYGDLTKPAASFENMKDNESHARLLNDLEQIIDSARQQAMRRPGVVVNFAPKAETGVWGFAQDMTELEIFG